MRKVIFGILLLFLFITPGIAQDIVVEVGVATKANAVSTNIVFVVDASSTINRYPIIRKKFDKGWNFITKRFASDQLYFCVYTFSGPGDEHKTEWIEAAGADGIKEFDKAKKWIDSRKNGVASWGLKAIRMALREKNKLDKNHATAKRLTIVLFTDGGLSEAAGPRIESEQETLDSPLSKHVYNWTGSYNVVNKMIAQEQALRVKRGLEEATILTIGYENLEADKEYGMDVKQRDPECQAWLRMIGEKYRGGNILIRTKK